MPDPARIVDPLPRLDRNRRPGEVPDPCLEHAAERVQPRAGEAEVEHGIEAVVARPVDRGVAFVEDVQLDLLRRRVAFEQEVRADSRLRQRARDSAERSLRALLLTLGYREVLFVESLPTATAG